MHKFFAMKRALLSKQYPFGIGKHSRDKFAADAQASASISHNLLLKSGLIMPSGPGIFQLMPMLVRSIEKLTRIVDDKMRDIDAHKVMLSHLGEKEVWQKTARWDNFGNELVKTKLGSAEYCLCPTHEESICNALLHYNKQLSHAHCPMRFYQTTHKFRNEPRPHHGLLRCREFLMNDLYTFDSSEASSRATYKQVTDMYDDLFKHLGIDVSRVEASTGLIGGNLSHEYHILSDIGQDTLCIDTNTGRTLSKEYAKERNIDVTSFTHTQAIEVGHTFLLGTRYSEELGLKFVGKESKFLPFEMGCYGLGITRLVAACLESMSSENGLRWPYVLAPYKICIVLPKEGSSEWEVGIRAAESLFTSLNSISSFHNDIVVDDYLNRTIGWKLAHANLIGYPVVIVIGKHITAEVPKVEVQIQGFKTTSTLVSLESAVELISDKVKTFGVQ